MAITDIAANTAELEQTRNALEDTRKQLESARDINNNLMKSLHGQSATSHAQGSIAQRYAALIAIGALAAWQVYLTLQLKVLLN
jgi:predicted alpha/beta hydrolase